MPTLEEAKTQWCPMARVVIIPSGEQIPTSATYNRITVVEGNGEQRNVLPQSARCVANRCALWDAGGDDPNEGACGLIHPL